MARVGSLSWRPLALAAALALASPTTATAGPDLQEATAAYHQGDYQAAFAGFAPAAEAGDPYAQRMLGELYRTGRGTETDVAEAARWYREAAEQGDVEAQRRLAGMYRTGTGVASDPEEAARWYLEAAEGGHRIAQYIIGGLYYHGQGVERDPVQAYKWLALAKTRGQRGPEGMLESLEEELSAAELEEARALARERLGD